MFPASNKQLSFGVNSIFSYSQRVHFHSIWIILQKSKNPWSHDRVNQRYLIIIHARTLCARNEFHFFDYGTLGERNSDMNSIKIENSRTFLQFNGCCRLCREIIRNRLHRRNISSDLRNELNVYTVVKPLNWCWSNRVNNTWIVCFQHLWSQKMWVFSFYWIGLQNKTRHRGRPNTTADKFMFNAPAFRYYHLHSQRHNWFHAFTCRDFELASLKLGTH